VRVCFGSTFCIQYNLEHLTCNGFWNQNHCHNQKGVIKFRRKFHDFSLSKYKNILSVFFSNLATRVQYALDLAYLGLELEVRNVLGRFPDFVIAFIDLLLDYLHNSNQKFVEAVEPVEAEFILQQLEFL